MRKYLNDSLYGEKFIDKLWIYEVRERVLYAEHSPSRALWTGWQLSMWVAKSNCKPSWVTGFPSPTATLKELCNHLLHLKCASVSSHCHFSCVGEGSQHSVSKKHLLSQYSELQVIVSTRVWPWIITSEFGGILNSSFSRFLPKKHRCCSYFQSLAISFPSPSWISL